MTSRRCNNCADGFYNLTAASVFGCDFCNCDVGGAVNSVCDKITGQCSCRPRITGERCNAPLTAHYYPTLHELQYEAEEGITPSGGKVRFDYDESLFPAFSWKGYAKYSTLQSETLHDVNVEKSSLYLLIFRYLNPGDDVVVGEIVVTPDNPQDEVQNYKLRFEPKGEFLTANIQGTPIPFVLNPGRWQFSIKIDQYLLLVGY